MLSRLSNSTGSIKTNRDTCASLRRTRRNYQNVACSVTKRPVVAIGDAPKKLKLSSAVRPALATICVSNTYSASGPRIEAGKVLPPAKAKRFSLPRSLPQPNTPEVNPSHYTKVHPELKDVQPQYIRDHLSVKGIEMLSASASTHPSSPLTSSPLPRALQVVTPSTSARPTHMLAVYSNTPNSKKRKVTMFATHQLVLAAHCSRLPSLPSPSTSSCSESTVLPVVPLCLPSPETFPLLQTYLYVKRADVLYNALIPSTLDLMTPETMFSPLTRQALAIHGVWRNACALGVIDDGLYDVIDKAWESVLSSLSSVSSLSSCSLPSSTTIASPTILA